MELLFKQINTLGQLTHGNIRTFFSTRQSADPEKVTYSAAKRYSQRKKLSEGAVADEKRLSSIRCKLEHAFHRIKVQFGYKKVRYRGLAKNTARLIMLASIANMFIAACYESRSEVSFG